MRRPIATTALSLVAGLALGACSAGGGYDTSPTAHESDLTGGTPAFHEADRNDNRQISLSEAHLAGITNAEAQAADVDGDGKLSESEWQQVKAESEGYDAIADPDASGSMPDYTDKTDKSGSDEKIYD